MAAASKKFVSKLGKVAFQEVDVHNKRFQVVTPQEVEASVWTPMICTDLVCKKAGACGEKKNDCPKSKGDLGAVLGAIAGVAHKKFLDAEAKNRQKAIPPSKFEESNNQASPTEQISTLKTESGKSAIEAGGGGGEAGGKEKKKKCGKGKGIVEKVVCFIKKVVKHVKEAHGKIKNAFAFKQIEGHFLNPSCMRPATLICTSQLG